VLGLSGPSQPPWCPGGSSGSSSSSSSSSSSRIKPQIGCCTAGHQGSRCRTAHADHNDMA
jgi:hypothetical protein